MRHYGLIGRPLGHSWSRQWMRRYFADHAIDADYANHPLDDISLLPALVADDPMLYGLNVTSPYKEAVMPYLDAVSPTARRVGAVNVIAIERGCGTVQLTGYNTDVEGFADSLRGIDLPDKALILGTGGASKAVCEALRGLGTECAVVSRTPAPGRLTYADLTPDIVASHRLIVNATPLGMAPLQNQCAPLPYEVIGPEHVCYDLVYNPEETLFLRQSRARGARTINGLAMLEGQARATLRVWGLLAPEGR